MILFTATGRPVNMDLCAYVRITTTRERNQTEDDPSVQFSVWLRMAALGASSEGAETLVADGLPRDWAFSLSEGIGNAWAEDTPGRTFEVNDYLNDIAAGRELPIPKNKTNRIWKAHLESVRAEALREANSHA